MLRIGKNVMPLRGLRSWLVSEALRISAIIEPQQGEPLAFVFQLCGTGGTGRQWTSRAAIVWAAVARQCRSSAAAVPQPPLAIAGTVLEFWSCGSMATSVC